MSRAGSCLDNAVAESFFATLKDRARFRFDVRRSPNPHLTFGHGGHFCLGANLARIEIRLVLDGLLDRVDEVERAGPVEWTRSNKHTGLRHMPVTLHAANRSA